MSRSQDVKSQEMPLQGDIWADLSVAPIGTHGIVDLIQGKSRIKGAEAGIGADIRTTRRIIRRTGGEKGVRDGQDPGMGPMAGGTREAEAGKRATEGMGERGGKRGAEAGRTDGMDRGKEENRGRGEEGQGERSESRDN